MKMIVIINYLLRPFKSAVCNAPSLKIKLDALTVEGNVYLYQLPQSEVIATPGQVTVAAVPVVPQ